VYVPANELDQEILPKLVGLEAGLLGELLERPAPRLHDGQRVDAALAVSPQTLRGR
jgi:hypothetical protein